MAAVPDWVVYLAYALFVTGALLVIIGIIRVCWYCCVVRKEEKEDQKALKSFYDNPSYFTGYTRDPWLKPAVVRGAGDGDDSLHDVNISEFLQATRDDSARELSSQLQQSLAPEARTHIDSATVQSQAHYEEPNTNLILALKEQHAPPEDELSYGSGTHLVHEDGSDRHLVHEDGSGTHLVQENESGMHQEDGYVSARSEDTRAALSALDLATADEDRPTDTSHSEPASPRTPRTPHPTIATAHEPLPEELYVFSSNLYIQDSTEL